MANTFYRKPNPGGDTNAWATYNDAQNDASLGVITSQLFNDSGSLKVKVGKIGIDTGATRGIAFIDTETTIDISGVTNETWAKIEMAISGTTPVFTALDIAGATDPSEAPATFKDSYDGEKGGFYISTTKRVIGLAWKNSSGVLLAVINVCSHINDYWASEIGLHTGTIHQQRGPGKGFSVNIGDWNMNASAGGSGSKTVSVSFGDFLEQSLSRISILIRIDTGSDDRVHDNNAFNQGSGGSNVYCGYIVNNQIYMDGASGSDYDNAFYNDTSYNRGWITIFMRDF